MQDLFFLERPKTYADLNNLINRYEFEVLIYFVGRLEFNTFYFKKGKGAPKKQFVFFIF